MEFTNDWEAAFSFSTRAVVSGAQGHGVEGWRHCTFYHDTHLRSYAMMYFLMMVWSFCLVQPLIILFNEALTCYMNPTHRRPLGGVGEQYM
jgi:hypothetical protein